MLDALSPGTVRYSSKVVSNEELGRFKLLYLADGSAPKTKVGVVSLANLAIVLLLLYSPCLKLRVRVLLSHFLGML